jgi:hypothetical protein
VRDAVENEGRLAEAVEHEDFEVREIVAADAAGKRDRGTRPTRREIDVGVDVGRSRLSIGVEERPWIGVQC